MGLDMYAYAAPGGSVRKEVNFKMQKVKGAVELHYWRKHPNLHGFMEALYYAKGGKAEIFNCEPIVLTALDLDQLEAAVRGGALPDTSGFFFGESDGSERDDDLDFIRKARDVIDVGNIVIYDSWW